MDDKEKDCQLLKLRCEKAKVLQLTAKYTMYKSALYGFKVGDIRISVPFYFTRSSL